MREYIHQEVQNRQAYGRFTTWVRFVKNIAMRKNLKALLRFSDYQLRDIGLTRAELCRLLDMPVALDLGFELERTSARIEARHLADMAGQSGEERLQERVFTSNHTAKA